MDLVLRRLVEKGTHTFQPCRTNQMYLVGGGDLGSSGFVDFRQEWLHKWMEVGVEQELADELVSRYYFQIEKDMESDCRRWHHPY